MKTLVIVLWLLFASSGSAAGVDQQFEADYETTWRATVQELAGEGFRIRSSDPLAGVAYLNFGQEGEIGATNVSHLVARYTTKKVSSFSTWQILRIQDSSTVTVRRVSATRTAVNVILNFIGYNGFTGAWRNLPSNGTLEGLLLRSIERSLPRDAGLAIGSPVAGTEQNGRRDSTAERDLLRRFFYVGAAVENELPSDRVKSSLVEAQVALNEYEITKEGVRDSELTRLLRQALTLYRAGDNEKATKLVSDSAAIIATPAPRRRLRRGPGPGPLVRSP